MSDLQKTKFQMVQDEIEKIHYQHRHDAGGMMGVLSENEAIDKYNQLRLEVEGLVGLTDEEKQLLCNEIDKKIANTSQVEQEKVEEYEAYEAKKQQAFSDAKKRYKALSILKKLKLFLKKQNPSHINYEWSSTEELNNLYTKKR